jgi:hypothetical protein
MVAKSLEQAFQEAAKLPEDEQESVAQQIMELLSEHEWQKRFEATKPQLRKLAQEARRDRQEGRTEELDPDNL